MTEMIYFHYLPKLHFGFNKEIRTYMAVLRCTGLTEGRGRVTGTR